VRRENGGDEPSEDSDSEEQMREVAEDAIPMDRCGNVTAEHAGVSALRMRFLYSYVCPPNECALISMSFLVTIGTKICPIVLQIISLILILL